MKIPSEWVTRFTTMANAVQGWRGRVGGEPLFPQLGSELAADDETFPDLPVSAVAYNGIVTAVEHLDFFVAALDATERLYPAAHYTVLRPALMGAAQAVWVLAPEAGVTRRARALEIAVDDFNQERKLLPDAQELGGPDRQAAVEQERGPLLELLRAAAEVAGQLDMPRADKVREWTFNMTNVIKAAAEHTHGTGADTADIRASTRLLWRTQSGHAHGVPASRRRLAGADDIVITGDGSAWAAVSTSFADVAAAMAASVLLLNDAWLLYDLRTQIA